MNFFNIGPMELLLILVIVLMVFGPDKIPEVGASLGKAIRKFRQATKELAEEFDLEEITPTTLANVLEAQANALDQAQAAGTSTPPPEEASTPPAPAETPTGDAASGTPAEGGPAEGTPAPASLEHIPVETPSISQPIEDAEDRT
ncbi:MAG: twin-arginine translocase TatA/TatE family subunit [Anaerolineae bacterium]